MKKTYIIPQTNAIALNTEENILNGISQTGVITSDDDTIGGNDFLSNKKENPVWGGTTQKGPWDK